MLFIGKYLKPIEERLRAVEDALATDLEATAALKEELQGAIREYDRTIEDVQDRIDRGNKVWRRIRAAQKYAEERAEEEGWDELPEGDAPGGPEQAVLPLHQSVATFSSHSPDWEEKKRSLNRRLAGLE